MPSRLPASLLALGAVVATAGTVAGCGPHPQARPQAGVVTRTASPSPRPTITVIRAARSLVAGQSGDVAAQQGVSLRLRASRPSVSRTRLSSSYGYPPARGYYVTFTLTIVNTGSEPVAVGPANFRVRIPGEGTVTTNDGNAPYSGAAAQLDTTQIDPGETLSGPVTFDVRRPHGTLDYLPDRSAALEWRF